MKKELTKFQKRKKYLQRWKRSARCEWCGTKYNLTIDHITPKSRGGTNSLFNFRILCRRCHNNRHEKLSIWGGRYK